MTPTRPARVISLCPSITETVFALGAWPQLVGRTSYCVHPEELVEQVADVGGTKSIKLPRIRALKPDLILANMEENRQEDVEALRGEGFDVVTFFPRTVPETILYIRKLGGALGREIAADAVALELAEVLVQCRGRERPERPVRYAYLIWRKPWMVVGRPTFVDSLLAEAGLENVFAEAMDRYPSVEDAEFTKADPDVMLLSSEPFPFSDKHRDELCEGTGLAADRFMFVDGQLLSWHGSRTAKGLRYAMNLARALEARG